MRYRSRGLFVGASLLVLQVFAATAGAQALNWVRLGGRANDVGIGGFGTSVHIVGYGSGNRQVWRWDGGVGWMLMSGWATAITTDTQGNPWIVNKSGEIFRWNGSLWIRLPGKAKDIASGGGKVFIIGEGGGDKPLWEWNAGTNNWMLFTGGGIGERVAVDRNGNPWCVDGFGNIFGWVDGRWILLPGRAMDIGVCAGEADVHIVTVSSLDGQANRWDSVARVWRPLGGAGIRIDYNCGTPWLLNRHGHIYRGF